MLILLALIAFLALGVVGFFAAVMVSFVLGWLVLRFCMDQLFWVVDHRRKILRVAAKTSGYALAVTAPIGAILFACCTWYIYWDKSDIPNIQTLVDWQPEQISYLRDRKEQIVMRAATHFREVVPLSAIPETVQQALIAGEDKNFWEHAGWDRGATFRAVMKDSIGKKMHFRQQGASTITQQVVRKVYPTLADWNSRETNTALLVDNIFTRFLVRLKGPVFANRATRKLREIKYAHHTERLLAQRLGNRHKAKEFILQSYANLTYLGYGVYGMSYGAQFYFDKRLDQLDASEAAFLVSLFPNPEANGRIIEDAREHAAKKARRDAILNRMADNGFLTKAELAVELARPLRLNTALLKQKAKTEAPAVVNQAIHELEEHAFTQHQLHNGDIQISLTSDLAIQRTVNAAAWRGITEDFKKHFNVSGPLPQTCVVVMDNRTGAILALFGGFIPEDQYYSYTAYNRCLQAVRQPGSTIKGIDLIAAIMAGLTPDSIVMDVPAVVNMGHGKVKVIGNYDGKTLGPISLWEATAQSRNLAFLNMMRGQVGGAKPMIKWAREMGVKSRMDPYISTVLGADGMTPLELANVYRTIASGLEAEPFIIKQITDRQGRAVYTHTDTTKPFPMPREKLVLVQTLLRGTVKLPKGTARSLNTSDFPIQIIGKTGTSNDHRDAWFVGSTYGASGITIAVWVGHDDFSKSLPYEGRPWYDRASGGVVALPIAKYIFLGLYGQGKPLGQPPTIPDEITQRVDAYVCQTYPELCATK